VHKVSFFNNYLADYALLRSNQQFIGVWGILWQQKKQLLEEIFKRQLDLDLYSARAACGETANRYWLQFVDIQAAGNFI
jgi:hypothetical protein